MNDKKRKWFSVGLTVFIAGLLTLWGIYGIGKYGIALFILTPFFIGAGSTILYGYKKQITKMDAIKTGFLTLGVFTAGLIVCAIEGVICIAMAAPFGALLTWLGSLIGFSIVTKKPNSTPAAMIILIGMIPSVAFIEKDNKPTLTSVTTSIEISADPETVWKNVIEFPQLNEPTEFIFKTGIAYPINAEIEGVGVGAIRHCNFTTGSFVEPITVWNEPTLLKFDVAEQPEPMKELSFWDIDAPHLHDYFVSKQGQFKLVPLPNGKTKLEGTTWYYNNIAPEFYWQLWSDMIIHKIHWRVLTHIKANSEVKRTNGTTTTENNGSIISLHISILGCIYATLTLLTFKIFGHYKPDSWFEKISKKKLRLWFLSELFISVGLFFFMFTYFGNHGLGDSSRVPVGHWRAIQEVNGTQAYIQDEGPVNMLEIDKFTLTDDYVYGLAGDANENYDGKYFIYDLINNKVKTFEHEKDFFEYLTAQNLATKPDYKNFSYYYSRYWNGWRFWLLP